MKFFAAGSFFGGMVLGLWYLASGEYLMSIGGFVAATIGLVLLVLK